MDSLIATWPAPANISALTTRRTSGYSQQPYDSNNLGLHVGDKAEHVLQNRNQLRQTYKLPSEPLWLDQIHSNHCILAETDPNRQADAAITKNKQQVLAIMTGDCLPILICNKQGTEIAAIHGGWRGLVNGIIENTLEKMDSNPKDLLAWIGPGICQSCYEVGQEVFEACTSKHAFTAAAFQPHHKKWLANLPLLAELILHKSSVLSVFQANSCTFERKNDFFSYRREPQTGRMATLIWFNEGNSAPRRP